MIRLLLTFAIAVMFAPSVQAEHDENRTRTIVLVGGCETTTAQVVLQYSPAPGTWRKAGWFSVEPGERFHPTKNGTRLRHRDNAELAIYGESADGKYTIEGDHGINYRGKHLKAQLADVLIRGNFVEFWVLC